MDPTSLDQGMWSLLPSTAAPGVEQLAAGLADGAEASPSPRAAGGVEGVPDTGGTD